MYKLQSLKIKNIISFRDQEFIFRNGKAILIVGQNLDDRPSQNGNGSGKSALLESIAVGFTGCSIRDVKTKELINNEAEFAEVELTMKNANNQEFKIWRKIYGNTKSAEYRSWLNGKECNDCYSDFNSFNSFVFETIGISKEDFFSFYLINKDNYEPFLRLGDVKKKEIINRFSGADKIDNAIPLVEEDCETIQTEITKLEKELLQNKTKQELLSEQLIQLENELSEETKQKQIEELELKYQTLKDQEENYLIEIDEAKKLIEENKNSLLLHLNSRIDLFSDLETELETNKNLVNSFKFSINFQHELNALESKKVLLTKSIASKNLELKNVKNKFTEEINSIIAEENQLKEDIKLAEQELKENETFESNVSKQLLDSIECPNCHFVFNLKDKTFNAKEAKLKLPEVKETIKELKSIIQELKESLNTDIQQNKTDINNKIIKAGETIRNEINDLNRQLIDISDKEWELTNQFNKEKNNKRKLEDAVSATERKFVEKENKFNTETDNLNYQIKKSETNLKNKVDNYSYFVMKLENSLQSINDFKNKEIDNKPKIDLENKISLLIKEESELSDKLEYKIKEKQDIDCWTLNFKNFKSHLANKSIKNISDYTNLFLDAMGSNLSINIDGYKVLSNKKIKEQITTNVLRDGFDAGSYGKFSGGERARIDCASILALQELIQLNVKEGKGINFLCIDEILESVDYDGMQSIVESLQDLGKTIMIVSQLAINSLADVTVTIKKENKVSTILN